MMLAKVEAMRIILFLWAIPLFLFWGWYALSFNDISFGTVFFSRELHDLVFHIYGQTLGVAPDEVPGIVAGACAFDTAIILGIAAWRWRSSWVPQAMKAIAQLASKFPSGDAGRPAESEPQFAPAVSVSQGGPTRPAE